MSAVRMMAYGVWEDPGSMGTPPAFLSDKDESDFNARKKLRDTQRRLVRDELKEYQLVIQNASFEKTINGRRQFRSRDNYFVLYGPPAHKSTPKGWTVRGILGEGTFKECCIMAVKWMEPDNEALQSMDFSPQNYKG